MSRLTVIVAPWGNPFGWGAATYSLSEEHREVTVRDRRTSLACLVEALEPDAVVVIIPETVLCPGSRHVEQLRQRGGRPLSEVLESGEPYSSAIEALESAMTKLYEEWVGGPSPRIVVAPAVGEYDCEGKRCAWSVGLRRVDPVSAYAAFVLVSVAAVADLRAMGSSEVLIALDTTHGVNYMPLAAYRATMAAARVLSAALNVRVEFRQYNSAPYPRGALGRVALEIFRVRSEVITPNKAAQRLVYSYLLREAGHAKPLLRAREAGIELPEWLSDVEGRFEWLRSLHSDVSPLAASIHFSMPLAFLQLGLECASKYAGKLRTGWLSELSEALRRVLGLVQVSEDRGRVRVRHLAMPRYDDIKSLLAAASLVMYSRHALDRAKLAVSRGVVEASLVELREVAESWLRGPLLGVAMHEIRAFEKAHARRSAPDALPLLIGEARAREGEWASLKRGCENDSRIYVAHAGLASASIEVRVEGSELRVRYRKQCLSNLRSCLRGALRETLRLVSGD